MERCFTTAIVVFALATTAIAAPIPTQTEDKPPGPKFVAKTYDGSTINLELADEKIEIQTKYGNLNIETKDIQKIELRTRCPAKLEQQITEWIGKLGHEDFKVRENATNCLKQTGERAYHATNKATKSNDPEVARRAAETVSWIKARNRINTKNTDTVTTTDGSVINGNLSGEYLNVNTPTFGKQELKLYDICCLTNGSGNRSSEVLPAPTSLALGGYSKKYGTYATFKITLPNAPENNVNVSVWGSGPYSVDSNLAHAALHAGLGQPGETIEITVLIKESVAKLEGSNLNGIQTQSYGMDPNGSFEFVK